MSFSQPGVAASVVDEGTAFAHCAGDNPAEKDGVIATWPRGFAGALDMGHRTIQARRTHLPIEPADAVKILGGLGLREAA